MWRTDPHRFTLRLLDQDGNPVTMQAGPNAPVQPVQIEGQFTVDRQGVAPGTPLDGLAAINFGPLPLQPASRYVWELAIDGHSDEDWRLAFTTRPRSPMQLAS
jgi:hypothetical protein